MLLRLHRVAHFYYYPDEFAPKDADFKAVYEQWKEFRDRIYAWNKLNEASFTSYVYAQIK